MVSSPAAGAAGVGGAVVRGGAAADVLVAVSVAADVLVASVVGSEPQPARPKAAATTPAQTIVLVFTDPSLSGAAGELSNGTSRALTVAPAA